MKSKSLIYNIMSTASLLLAVLAIVFSTLMAAHANMTVNVTLDQYTAQHETGDYKSTPVQTDTAVNSACNLSVDGMQSPHDGAECCAAMCGSAMLLEATPLSNTETAHTHFASSDSQMKSVGTARLMRPPSL